MTNNKPYTDKGTLIAMLERACVRFSESRTYGNWVVVEGLLEFTFDGSDMLICAEQHL